MDSFKISPGWATQSRFTGSSGINRLEPCDIALAMRVIGVLASDVPPDPASQPEFENAMRAALARPDTDPCGLPVDIRSADVGFRNLGHLARAVVRMRDLRNGGDRCFSSIELIHDGKAARFTSACGGGLLPAHPVFAKVGSLAARRAINDSIPFADRPFVVVRPDHFARFATVSTAPIALRLLTWLTTPNRNGMPSRNHAEVDDVGRWTIRCGIEEIERIWGLVPARVDLVYYTTLFERIAKDLAVIGIVFKAGARRISRSTSRWTFRFWLGQTMQPWIDRLDEADVPNPRYTAAAVRTLPMGSVKQPVPAPIDLDDQLAEAFAPDVAPIAKTIVEPEPVAEPIAAVEVPIAIETVVETIPDAVVPVVPEEPKMPMYVRNWTANRDRREDLPPWLKRRFVYTDPDDRRICSDRPLEPASVRHRVLRSDVGCWIWCEGMDARPVQVFSNQELKKAGYRALKRRDWVNYSLKKFVETRAGYKDVPTWAEYELDELDTRPRYQPQADDDWLGHKPEIKRTFFPRDPKSVSGTPHDGIGLVDDAGNPIDKAGNPEDRSVLEGKYDAMLLSRPGPTT